MSPEEIAAMLEQNRLDLNAGLAKAHQVVDSLRARSGPPSGDHAHDLVEWTRNLSEERRQQLIVNSLLMAAQLTDSLHAHRAFQARTGKRAK